MLITQFWGVEFSYKLIVYESFKIRVVDSTMLTGGDESCQVKVYVWVRLVTMSNGKVKNSVKSLECFTFELYNVIMLSHKRGTVRETFSDGVSIQYLYLIKSSNLLSTNCCNKCTSKVVFPHLTSWKYLLLYQVWSFQTLKQIVELKSYSHIVSSHLKTNIPIATKDCWFYQSYRRKLHQIHLRRTRLLAEISFSYLYQSLSVWIEMLQWVFGVYTRHIVRSEKCKLSLEYFASSQTNNILYGVVCLGYKE